MRSNAASPNELIGIGITLIVIGIIGLATIDQETRVKLIIGSFVMPVAGIIALILGVVRKFRKQ